MQEVTLYCRHIPKATVSFSEHVSESIIGVTLWNVLFGFSFMLQETSFTSAAYNQKICELLVDIR